ncbi:MAG: hypothetical protein V3S56_09260, partial [Gemmatimonadota bacterium]
MRHLSALLTVLLIVAATSTACAATTVQNTLTDAERDAGWRLLFDGESLDGWRSYYFLELPVRRGRMFSG